MGLSVAGFNAVWKSDGLVSSGTKRADEGWTRAQIATLSWESFRAEQARLQTKQFS